MHILTHVCCRMSAKLDTPNRATAPITTITTNTLDNIHVSHIHVQVVNIRLRTHTCTGSTSRVTTHTCTGSNH